MSFRKLVVFIGYKVMLLILFVNNATTYSNESVQPVLLWDNTESNVRHIAAGTITEFGEFPFMAALGWRNEFNSLDFHCGGLLIGSKMVLTAAHCIYLDGGVSYSDIPREFNQTGSSLDNSPQTDVLQIVGGEITINNEFPFMAALGWVDEHGDVDFHCGGVLISSSMVLTAAHCVYLDGKIPDVVHIGGNPLSQRSSPTYNREYAVVNATIFPEYNSSQAYHDIALLELESCAVVHPVCLWTKPNLYVNDVTAIGYGLTAFAGEQSEGLLKVNLTVFPEKFCEPFFKRQRKFKSGLSHAHICAGDTNGQKDTCQGDSGGPLIVVHRFRPYAVGITSTGQACSGFPPAIYTKISSYIGWIRKVLSERGYTLERVCH